MCDKPMFEMVSREKCPHNCFTEGRDTYMAPIAIVLHEVDMSIEELNNDVNSCRGDYEERSCHDSFHFGVGQGGEIRNWVEPDDTAWSFALNNASTTCGTCGWTVAANEGAAVDPNLYTINIAVTSGFITGSGRDNNYSQDQYDALVRLVGWLAQTHSITVDQTMVWRHCNELDDFPDTCPEEPTWADFLNEVQACIDDTDGELPMYLCDQICDASVAVGAPAYIIGADAECLNCNRYAFDLCSMFTSLPQACETMSTLYMVGIDDQAACSYMPIDMTCTDPTPACAVLGVDANGCLGLRPAVDHLVDRTAGNGDSLLPDTDRVVLLDADQGSIIFTLVAPTSSCCQRDYWIKRMDCNGGNSVTINGGLDTIEGQVAITLDTPCVWGRGEAIHLYWTGSEWIAI